MRNITMAYLDFLGEIMARRDREEADRAQNDARAETYDHDLTTALGMWLRRKGCHFRHTG